MFLKFFGFLHQLNCKLFFCHRGGDSTVISDCDGSITSQEGSDMRSDSADCT